MSFGGKPGEPVKLDIALGPETVVHSYDLKGRLNVTLRYTGLRAKSGHNDLRGRDLRYIYFTIAGDPDSLTVGAASHYRRFVLFGYDIAMDEVHQFVTDEKDFQFNGCTLHALKIIMQVKGNTGGSNGYSEHWYSPKLKYDVEQHSSSLGADHQDFRISNFEVR